MKKPQLVALMPLFLGGLLLGGCYTQFTTTEDRDSYREGDYSESTADTTGASDYQSSRERFYGDSYYYGSPFTVTVGTYWGGPWPSYGGWWGYDPFWYYPYYPYYPVFYGGGYVPGWYYPYYGAGGVVVKPSGVRTFGSVRNTGTYRAGAGTTRAGSLSPASSRSGSSSSSFLPGGVRSMPARGGNTSAREGGSRPVPQTSSATRPSGSGRNAPRGERVRSYTPPPPPSSSSPRHGGDRAGGGGQTYTSPRSSPPPSSSPSGGSSGGAREGGSRSGGGESHSGGSGRSGGRR